MRQKVFQPLFAFILKPYVCLSIIRKYFFPFLFYCTKIFLQKNISKITVLPFFSGYFHLPSRSTVSRSLHTKPSLDSWIELLKERASPLQLLCPSILRGSPAFSRRRAAVLSSLFPLRGVHITAGRLFHNIGNSSEFPMLWKSRGTFVPRLTCSAAVLTDCSKDAFLPSILIFGLPPLQLIPISPKFSFPEREERKLRGSSLQTALVVPLIDADDLIEPFKPFVLLFVSHPHQVVHLL